MLWELQFLQDTLRPRRTPTRSPPGCHSCMRSATAVRPREIRELSTQMREYNGCRHEMSSYSPIHHTPASLASTIVGFSSVSRIAYATTARTLQLISKMMRLAEFFWLPKQRQHIFRPIFRPILRSRRPGRHKPQSNINTLPLTQ